ncbi:hypothetical protein BOTBODRAFT_122065, partial [Botryobasidium botryosum FD-172 SS1]
LELKQITKKFGSLLANDQIDLKVENGEIHAILGENGAGKSTLMNIVYGLVNADSGSILVDGKTVEINEPADALKFGIGMNLILDTHELPQYSKNMQLARNSINNSASTLTKEFDIRTQSIFDHASSLSGGNKQKVVLARELTRKVELVVASQPTRGLDVGSIEFVYEKLLAEREANKAVLLISSELDEVVALADRIAVIYKGEIVGIVDANVPREKLGLMMAGIT